MNPQEFNKTAQEFAKKITKKSLILLSGDLGAGKTEFVKSIVEAKGGKALSPTFSLHHEYNCQGLIIDHWDLYRLESEDDLESSGFWDQFQQKEFVIFVEWPEKINLSWIPKDLDLWRIRIEIIDSDSRNIVVSGVQK